MGEVIQAYFPVVVIVAFFAVVLWVIRRLERTDEDRMARQLAVHGWRVKQGGSMLVFMPFRIYWADWISKWLIYTRPLAIKEADEFRAWFFECSPYWPVAMLAVEHRWDSYPRVALRTWESCRLSRFWRFSDPYLTERFPELSRKCLMKTWGDRERAAAFLSRIAPAILQTEGIFSVQTYDNFIIVISMHLVSGPEGRMSFAACAAKIFEAAGIQDLFKKEALKR